MARGDIPTPPGTGHIYTLTADQKSTLKEIWSIIFSVADSGEAVLPAAMMKEIQEEATSASGTQTASVQAAIKAGWFSGDKAAKAEADAQAAGFEPGMAKISLKDIGLSVDKLRPILWDNIMGDHPDALVLRFVRARKWNVVNAFNMMIKAFKWRLDEDIAAIKYSTDELLNETHPKFFEQLDSGKFYIHGTDCENRVVAYLNVRLHKPSDQPARTLEKLTIYVMECARVLLEHPVETVCLVFDLTGFSLSNVDFAMLRYLITVFEAYYPESLGRVLIHGAPFVFWGVWKVIEPWLDPVVAAKIRFTRSDKDLLEHIPAKHLPDRYKGGLDKYTYSYPRAQPGENSCMEDTEKKEKLTAEWEASLWKFEALTREWIKAGTPEATTARSEAEVEKEREEVVKQVRTAFFKMDPYIRARNMFHRTSPAIAKADGSVEWLYNS